MSNTTGRARVSITNAARFHAILIPSALAVIVIAIWLPLELREFAAQLGRYRESYVETRKELIRNMVNQFADSVPDMLAEASANGARDPQATAQRQMILWIGNTRYPQNGYAWALRADGSMVVHPFYTRQRRPEVGTRSGGLSIPATRIFRSSCTG